MDNLLSALRQVLANLHLNPKFEQVPASEQDRNTMLGFLIRRSDQLAQQQANANLIDKYKNFHKEEMWQSDTGYEEARNKNTDFATSVLPINNAGLPATVLANIFAGVNAQRSGIPLPILKVAAMLWTLKNQVNTLRGSPNTNSPVQELKDWKLYDAGYNFSQQNNDLNRQNVLKMIENSKEVSPFFTQPSTQPTSSFDPTSFSGNNNQYSKNQVNQIPSIGLGISGFPLANFS